MVRSSAVTQPGMEEVGGPTWSRDAGAEPVQLDTGFSDP